MAGLSGQAAVRAALRRADDRPLVWLDSGAERSGAELERRTEGLARALAAAGLAGRRVGLWYQNSFASIEAHLAIEWIGATRVPVDPAAAASEAEAVFAAAGVDAVLADAPHGGNGALVHTDDVPLRGRAALPDAPIPDDRVLHLFPRSVEAGQLRAVPISYGNWEARLRASSAILRRGGYGAPLAEDDRFLTAQQVMHGTSIIGTFPFLRLGLPQLVLERFDARAALEAILARRITTAFLVPGMVSRLAAAVRAAGSPELPLRRLLYGGAPFPRADLLDAIECFGTALVQLYGHWAGAWPISTLSGEDHARIARDPDTPIAASCGRPVPDVEVRLRPLAGAADGRRELCVRGPTVVADYADPDGWYGLGDVARADADGYLYLEGRIDGLINTGAYHVYPGEIEEALTALPDVRAARVVGEPDPTWGQAVTGYVVPDRDGLDPAALRTALRTRLAPYKIPKQIHLVAQLP